MGIAAVLLGSCSSSAGSVGLPTWSVPAGAGEVLCAAALHTPFTLAGDPKVSPVAWGVNIDGRRIDIEWPPGFTARFAPDLEILNPADACGANAGDHKMWSPAVLG